MSGFFFLLVFLIIRLGLPYALNKDALRRAAHFAPMYGKERIAYYFYQAANVSIFILPIFLTVKINFDRYFYFGGFFYLIGLCLCAVTLINYSNPNNEGLNLNGVYKFSRNPMYVSYFFFFMGLALLTRSSALFFILIVFQISTHWIILAEERWCSEQFGTDYDLYMKRVRRYF